MNALDLRADHPELLSDYQPNGERSLWRRVAMAVRRVTTPKARLKQTAAR
ncbi:MAG TPA: hypothetical protein VMM60_14375 [Ilumatobacter sp.]|nr:hypothetical protein [Ilumatobacter sp.]